MVRRVLLRSGFLALALIGARMTSAAQIQFTGNVENDFPAGPGIGIVIDNPVAGPPVRDRSAIPMTSRRPPG